MRRFIGALMLLIVGAIATSYWVPAIHDKACEVAPVLVLGRCEGPLGSLASTPAASPEPSRSPARPSEGPATPSGAPSASAAARVVELDETEDITLLQNGAPMTTLAVTPGETITFRIHNTAQDVDHEFFIGPTDKLANDVEGGLTGGPVNAGQTVDVTYTVTANSIGLQMGCPLLGHYVTMHADLVAAP